MDFSFTQKVIYLKNIYLKTIHLFKKTPIKLETVSIVYKS